MSCNDKIRQKCGTKSFATCTEYQGNPPAFSSLTEGCLDVEEVIDDIYEILTNLRAQIAAQGILIAAQQEQLTNTL